MFWLALIDFSGYLLVLRLWVKLLVRAGRDTEAMVHIGTNAIRVRAGLRFCRTTFVE